MASQGIRISSTGVEPGGWRATMAGLGRRAGSILAALALIGATIALGFILASYHVTDPALNTAAGGPALNIFGAFGAWISDVALSLFGPAFAITLPLGLIWGLRLWRGHPVGRWGRSLIIALFAVLLIGIGLALFRSGSVAGLPAGFGGSLGLGGAALIALGLDQLADPMLANGLRLGSAMLFAIVGISFWMWGLGLLADERDWLFRRGAYARRSSEPFDADEDIDESDIDAIDRMAVPVRPPRHAPVAAADDTPPPRARKRPRSAFFRLTSSAWTTPVSRRAARSRSSCASS